VFSPMKPAAAVVLAAGEGTRMKSRLPKVLHPICGRAMVAHVVDAAREAGCSPVCVVVAAESQAIRQVLGDSVVYAEQPHPIGSGDALLRARSLLGAVDQVAVLYADVPLGRPETLRSMIELHLEREACLTLLTSRVTPPDGLARVVRDGSGRVVSVVEERDADPDTRAIREINAGVYVFKGPWLWDALGDLKPSDSGEVYLTGLVALAHRAALPVESVESTDPDETLGVNNRVQLARAEDALRQRIRERWMMAGVTMHDPSTVYVDSEVELGEDTVLHPNTHLSGHTVVGQGCEIGPNSVLKDARLGPGCRVVSSHIEEARLDEDVRVGPNSRIRAGSHLERGVYVGNFAEVKNSRLGPGTKAGHFS